MSHLFVPNRNPYSPAYIPDVTDKNNHLSMAKILSITTVVKDNKMNNDMLKYLIILKKDDYRSSTFSKSTFEKLNENRELFNGFLNIEKLESFMNDNEGNNTIHNKYQIDGNITPRILYIRLPKEKLYVSADVFQERYLDSKINELITIFSTLCSKTIKITVIHENSSNINFNVGAEVSVKCIDVKAKAGKEKDKNNKITTTREITFQEPDTNENLNVDVFGNYIKFFYLPKDESWINIIRRRINNKSLGDEYKYNYKDYNCVSKELSAHLKMLHISLQYNSSKYENLVIEYDVDYYPFTKDVPKVADSDTSENIKTPAGVLDFMNPFNFFGKLFS
jgi:hypothetical protein